MDTITVVSLSKCICSEFTRCGYCDTLYFVAIERINREQDLPKLEFNEVYPVPVLVISYR